MTKSEIVEQLVKILDAYERKTPLISNQGQALDGFSALSNFVNLAKKARNAKDMTGDEMIAHLTKKGFVVLQR